MGEAGDDSALLFDVLTPLEFRVHCYQSYWIRKVIAQHPIMRDQVEDVIRTLREPLEVRLSTSDDQVYLFYSSGEKRFVCVVARRMGSDGYLITAYPADRIKAGTQVWTS